ncbi:MAG: PIG-L family deacetylase [Ferruginibacter sp.]
MRRLLSFVLVNIISFSTFSQTPKTYNSAEILLQLKKLNVLGSVLYIAAHPDDENNTLLPYLAKEKLYRTAYLSLTRGDGGQNLIGDEQGIDLGLIRTQELIAARKVDGGEQYFSRAYEFGFSKSAEEALRIWDKEKILSDVVWVIRKYQPDIIIKRFPPDSRAGHGHHAASSILAEEAFTAAADPKRFPEQFKYGVKPWQAKRILWNTYNFGNNNTTSDDQLKIDIGGFNPLVGKSYGEIGAEARTMHKSQGEGRPRRRGQIFEYFATTGGEPAKNTLMDGIDISWSRLQGGKEIESMINNLVANFKTDQPSSSVPALIDLYDRIAKLPGDNWRNKKLSDVQELIEACSGIFMEMIAQNQLNVIGDSAKFTINLNNRLGVAVNKVEVSFMGETRSFENLKTNENITQAVAINLSKENTATQPYWLERPIQGGAYDVSEQTAIGEPENAGYPAIFKVTIANHVYTFEKRVLYKFTDPVKGELYEPIQIINPVLINSSPSIVIFSNDSKNQSKVLHYNVQSNLELKEKVQFKIVYDHKEKVVFDSVVNYSKAAIKTIDVSINSDELKNNSSVSAGAELSAGSLYEHQYFALRKISYDHIPDLYYNFYDKTKIIKMDLKTVGKRIGYIIGAGDKVPSALEAMGYDVRYLSESDITDDNLKQFDAIVTGIRAYNISEWLSNKNDVLMRYVENGGNMIVQYLKSNTVGQKKVKVGPYPFIVDPQTRVTEEDAVVNFLLPDHPALNYPNKITADDFKDWVQERSTYQMVQIDSHYETPLGMNDKSEKESNGSLAIAKYGKGNFVYTGLVFFRQLPAGVPGAFRLMANLIALARR